MTLDLFKKSKRENWYFNKTISDGETFKIKNLNIWDYEWKTINRQVEVIDPLYKQKYYFDEFQITDGKTIVNFVAGEFSNTIFGIYLKDKASIN